MVEKLSDEFEHQIERIHRVLEENADDVTWNDKIADPDNPDQLRQIDITIKRNDELIHVECRLHKNPQDVKWIEELIGRRESLRAAAMIAVSSSGFTEGAARKAVRFNVHLRTFQQLTDDEILVWADAKRVKAIFYEFNDSVLAFDLPTDRLPASLTIAQEDGGPINWRGLFELAMAHFENDAELDQVTKEFRVEIFAPLVVCGIKPSKIHLHSKVRRIAQELPLSNVFGYMSANDEERARVQKHGEGSVEIIDAGDSVAEGRREALE